MGSKLEYGLPAVTCPEAELYGCQLPTVQQRASRGEIINDLPSILGSSNPDVYHTSMSEYVPSLRKNDSESGELEHCTVQKKGRLDVMS